MITIEEAHKFLNPSAAKQTIFGTIAREMRKYYVSLLVVDQRPSGIDDEVLSQIGTRITALLNDEKDIQAVLTGVSGTDGLRSVLASLDSKQQALVIGHAVPMPVVIKTREYGAQFYRDMGCLDDVPPAERRAQVEKRPTRFTGITENGRGVLMPRPTGRLQGYVSTYFETADSARLSNGAGLCPVGPGGLCSFFQAALERAPAVGWGGPPVGLQFKVGRERTASTPGATISHCHG